MSHPTTKAPTTPPAKPDEKNNHVPDELVTKIFSQFTEEIGNMLVQTVTRIGVLHEENQVSQDHLVEQAFSTGFKLGRATKQTEQEARSSFERAMAQARAAITEAQDVDYAQLEQVLHASFLKSGIPLSRDKVSQIVAALRHPLDRPGV